MILLGEVGWADKDQHYDLGTDGTEEDQITLVYVTLYDGAMPGGAPRGGMKARGRQIVCQVSSMFGHRIPAKHTRVHVSLPEAHERAHGAGLIIGTFEKTGKKPQFNADRVVVDYGPDTHVVIRAKSVTLQDQDGRFIAVGTPRAGGTPGVQVRLTDGTGAVWQQGAIGFFVAAGGEVKSIIQMTPDSIDTRIKGGALVQLKGSNYVSVGTSIALKGSAVYLGKAPLVGNFAAVYPLIVGVPAPSTSVFISL